MSDNAFIPFGPASGTAATPGTNLPKRWLEVLPAGGSSSTAGIAPALGPTSIAGQTAPLAPSSVTACEPKLRIEKDGDRVTQVLVECSCGRLMVLRCEY